MKAFTAITVHEKNGRAKSFSSLRGQCTNRKIIKPLWQKLARMDENLTRSLRKVRQEDTKLLVPRAPLTILSTNFSEMANNFNWVTR